MYSLNVTDLNKQSETSSSGALKITYAQQWNRNNYGDNGIEIDRTRSETSSSSVVSQDFGMPWSSIEADEHVSNIEYQQYDPSSGTPSIETHGAFLIIPSKFIDLTISKTTLDLSPKHIISNWQRENLPSILETISERFSAIRQRGDNWDSRDSKKPDPVSINKAEGILRDILITAIKDGYLWLSPFISSDEDGHITIEWHKGRHELHIEVQKNQAEYIKVWGTNIESEMHLDFLSPDEYLVLWEWLLHG